MPGPPRRKRFQIHLSTAIVLMFVTGGLIWANVSSYDKTDWVHVEDGIIIPSETVTYQYYGFPFYCAEDRYLMKDGDTVEIRETLLPLLNYPRAIADLTAALLILFTVYLLCEWRIRRRAARKGA